ncbi:unnamed protein product, partial [Symbiodinium pilosum]
MPMMWGSRHRSRRRVGRRVDEGKTWITAELTDGKVPVPREPKGKEFTVLRGAIDKARNQRGQNRFGSSASTLSFNE